MVTPRKRDRRWLTAKAMVGWLLTFAVMTIGGFLAWSALGAALCEDDDSPGSDAYCNHGGGEATGLAIVTLAILALILPGAGVLGGKRRLFWIGVVAPLALGVFVVVLSARLGQD